MNTQNILFLTRGVPGCGKSTFVNKYLKNISLIVESDEIRLQLNGFDTNNKISQGNEQIVWKTIYSKVEKLLLEKHNVSLDATNVTKWSITKVKQIAEKTNTRIIIINFSNISVETALQQNKNRLPIYKRVPEEVILRMYKEMNKSRNVKALEDLEIYTPDEFVKWMKENDLLYSI